MIRYLSGRRAGCVVMLACSAAAQAQWQTRAAMPYPAGQAAIARGLDGRFYLFGGWNSNPPSVGNTTRLQIYDPAADSWTTGAAVPVWSIGDMAVTLPSGQIHLLNNYYKQIRVYDPATNNWSGPVSAPWISYAARIVRTPDNRYFVFGGERPIALTYEYFPATFTASPRSPVPYAPETTYPTVRYPGAFVGDYGRVFVIGGLANQWEAYGAFDNVARYAPDADAWQQGFAPMPTKRFSFAYARGWDGRMYAMGGSNVYFMQAAPYYDMVEVYDPRADTWSTGPVLPEGRREAAAGIDDNGVIYVFGGSGPPSGHYQTTVFALATGVPRPPADFDGDGDVDQADLDRFMACGTGPGAGPPPSGCGRADADGDADVDQADFGVFQRCFSGGRLAEPGCGH